MKIQVVMVNESAAKFNETYQDTYGYGCRMVWKVCNLVKLNHQLYWHCDPHPRNYGYRRDTHPDLPIVKMKTWQEQDIYSSYLPFDQTQLDGLA
mgnify:CR=1 FL=1